MNSIDEIRKRLLRAEDYLSNRHDTAMVELSICLENIIREIINKCKISLKHIADLNTIKTVEDQIGGNKLSYHNFNLGQLHRLWKQAKIPIMWEKIHGRVPAIFTSLPLDEICDARNSSIHHAVSPTPIKVKKFFYCILEFLNEAFPINEELLCQQVGKSLIKNNLPQVDIDFIGRNREIEHVLNLLSKKSRAFLISITGAGGVGKSSLAIEVAHRCLEMSKHVSQKDSDHYFDALIWTSAKKIRFINDNTQDVITVKSSLDDIISEIIKVVAPDKYKNIPEQKAQYELVKDILSANRVLLFVDNMETIEDDKVISFLNDLPHPSKAIITDRRSVQSSRAIRLLELPEEDAASLIKSQCKINSIALNDENISELIEKTGGIPLAIVWAIGQMGAKGWGTDHVFRSLANTGSTPVLEFLFAESFRHISDKSRKVLAVLSIVDHPVTDIMIRDWLMYGTNDVQDAISELIQYALISEQKEDSCSINSNLPTNSRTYKILPLVRNFTMNQRNLTDDSLRVRIVSNLFMSLSNNEDNPDWPSPDKIDKIAFHHKLYSWAMEDSFNRKDYEMVFNIMRHIGYALGIRGYHDIRLKLGELAIEAAKRSQNKIEIARNLITNVGWVYFGWYKFEQCEKTMKEGLLYAEQAGDVALQGLAKRTIGLIKKENGDLLGAESDLHAVKDIFKIIGERYYLAITMGSLASLKRDQKDYDTSERYLSEAIEISKSLKNSEEITAVFLQKMTKLLVKTGKLDEAENFNRESYAIDCRLKRAVGIAHCKLNLFLIAEERGDLTQALAYANEAAGLFSQYGSKEDISEHLNRIRNKTDAKNFPIDTDNQKPGFDSHR